MKYEDLIGKPFEYGGRGDDSYDCFGLVIEIYKRNGIDLVDYGWNSDQAIIQTMMLAAKETPMWRKTALQPNAVLLFKVGRFVRHCGVYLGGNKFIHSWKRSEGVVIETLSVDWQNRLEGCYEFNQ